jgi:hypothetical protein
MVPDHETPTKATHGDPEELQAFAESTQKPEKKSAAQQLVELALECYDLGVDTDDKPFAVRKGGHVTRPLKGGKRSLRKELGGLFYRMTGKTASQNALAEAMDVLEFEATEKPSRPSSHVRVARTELTASSTSTSATRASGSSASPPPAGRSSTETPMCPCCSVARPSRSRCRPRSPAATSIGFGTSSTRLASTTGR